tara:strand:- start:11 stop:610 length:600 start_codon:yes stop_codon:yes gene_type:complete
MDHSNQKMPKTKKMEGIDKKRFNLSLLTVLSIGVLTVGCGSSKVNEPLLEVSDRGKQECLKRSDMGKNAFTAKQIYNDCLETIDEKLVLKDAFEAEQYYERQRKEEALKKQKEIENQKLKSELNKLKAEKAKLRQEKKRMAEAKNKKNIDDNDCKEGSIIGGVLGAGLTMSSTKGKDRWWAVPLGATAGSLVGCQIDGG